VTLAANHSPSEEQTDGWWFPSEEQTPRRSDSPATLFCARGNLAGDHLPTLGALRRSLAWGTFIGWRFASLPFFLNTKEHHD
jgi:hypothetical protein